MHRKLQLGKPVSVDVRERDETTDQWYSLRFGSTNTMMGYRMTSNSDTIDANIMLMIMNPTARRLQQHGTR